MLLSDFPFPPMHPNETVFIVLRTRGDQCAEIDQAITCMNVLKGQ